MSGSFPGLADRSKNSRKFCNQLIQAVFARIQQIKTDFQNELHQAKHHEQKNPDKSNGRSDDR
jgi:hypothetical protein